MSIDTIPNLKRDASGKLSADSAAVGALKALPNCDCPWPRGGGNQIHAVNCPRLIDTITDLEAEYERFAYKREGVPRWRAHLAWFFAAMPIRIFRLEIQALARAYQEEISRRKSNAVQSDVQAEFYRLHEDLRKLREFVEQNFPNDMRRCVAEEKAWFPDLVKELLLRSKG
jgi:hypothetical protein